MINKRVLRGTSAIIWAGGFMSLFFSTHVLADVPHAVTPPTAQSVDQNGIDLISMKAVTELPAISIGSSSSGIFRGGATRSSTFSDNFYGTLNKSVVGSNNYVSVTLGNQTFKFLNNSGVYTPVSGGIGTFTCTGTSCTFTTSDGTQALYDTNLRSNYNSFANFGMITTLTKPDGEVIRMTYRSAADSDPSGVKYSQTLKAVYSSLGWMVKYQVDTPSDPRAVYTVIDAINTSVDYCDPVAEGCSATTQTWVHTTNGGTTNALGSTFAISYQPLTNKTLKVTTGAGVVKTLGYTTGPLVAGDLNAVTIGSSVWNYNFTVSGNLKTITVTNPDTSLRGAVVDTVLTQLVSQTDELGRKTSLTYDTSGRLSRVINPDATYSGTTVTGGYTEYAYDSRSNVTTTTVVPKTGAGLSSLTSTAYYPLTCTNIKTCNRPTSVIDANGVTTTYTYDANSGGVASVTTPAVGGVSSQIRYTYAQQTPYVKNSSGALVASSPVWRLTETSSCMSGTAPSCLGTPDEVKTVITYGTSNVQPLTVTRKLGNNTLAQTTTYTYDNFGNVTSDDGPIPGADDTSYYFYDVLNRKVGTIGPDPDGSGTLQRQATRTTYSADNRVIAVERGSAAGTNLSALNTMTVLDKSASEFSTTTGLQTASKYYTGTNTSPSQVTETTYDSMFRTSCVAERLNPAIFAALPASACTLGTAGVGGPDKIVKYTYDVSGATLKVTSALGTAQQADDTTRTYNASNGTMATMADAKGNLTTYSYDNFNRQTKACFPTASTGTTSSTTDCEQIGYTNARQSSATLRDGQAINFVYNVAGTLANKTGAVTESFTYDNLGKAKTHTNNGLTETYTYNALGQLLSDAQPMGTVTYEYDAYGRRSKMTYPSSGGIPFYVSYSYYFDGSLLNEGVSYNGSAPTIQLQYVKDNFGRLTQIYRGPSSFPVATSVGYDALSNVSSVANNIGGTAYDNTTSYTFSTDDKIIKRTNSNPVFDYVVPLPGTLNKTYDGLNRDATIAAVGGYDTRGNMTSDGSITYSYNVNNLLTGTSTGASLAYDAENRLLNVTKSGVTTQFLYDGNTLIAEYNASNALQRRYVHGPDTDQPLLWYEGTSDTQLRYLTADSQGSIVSVTDSAGTSLSTNTYDAYGAGGSGNLGRFQFTGQSYLPEVGLYYYKARMYSQTMGRFMQTDPIGYGDGMNVYAYVHGDPVNGRDSTGLIDYNLSGLTSNSLGLTLNSLSSFGLGGDCLGCSQHWLEPNFDRMYLGNDLTFHPTMGGFGGGDEDSSPKIVIIVGGRKHDDAKELANWKQDFNLELFQFGFEGLACASGLAVIAAGGVATPASAGGSQALLISLGVYGGTLAACGTFAVHGYSLYTRLHRKTYGN